MACGRNKRLNCNDCSSNSNPCSEEKLNYLASQEFAEKIIANMDINELTTSSKKLIGALLEVDKELGLKQDHNATLDYLSTLSIDQVNAMIISGSKLT